MSVRTGDRLPVLHKRMTQEIIDSWAYISGDYNPLHTDPDFAAATRFGGTIARMAIWLWRGCVSRCCSGQACGGWRAANS